MKTPRKADRTISGIDGIQSTGRIIAEMIRLKEHEYGRGYLTAVSDLLPILEAELSAEVFMRVLSSFQTVIDRERTA